MSYGSGGYGPPPPPPQGPPPPGYGGPGGMGGPPPPPPPPGGGYGGEAPINKASPIILIVLGVLCCNCISLVLGIVSLTMAESNPKAAKTCALIGWILVALGIVVNIALFALGVFDAMLTPTGSYDTTY
ncbi:hypothetical protein [Nocardiopsis coralliicola]